jgi:hypothetical protein
MEDNQRKDKKESSVLVKSILGLSPIPVVGEIALSSLFYDLLDESAREIRHVAIPAAILTRFGMYSTLYAPLYEKAISLFS